MQTNRRSTRRSLLVSATALILSIAMLVGTTFAWFTDTVSSGVNKIQAGNLDIEVSYKDGNNWKSIEGEQSLFSSNLWEPGHTEYVTLKIENKGTLALNYKVLVSPVSESGGINVYNESFKLSKYLKFGTTGIADSETTYANREAARDAVQGSAVGLDEANLDSMTKAATMNAGDTRYMTLVVYMPEDIDNHANYKTGTAAPTIDLGVTVRATQKTQESDSFGEDYDAGAVNTPEYKAGAYYDYFEAVNETRNADGNGNFKVEKTDANSGIIASASGKANAGAEVNLIVMKSSDAEKNFTITVEDGHELNGYEIKVTGQEENSLVQGKLYVGTGLENFKFYHNSTEMTPGTQGSLTDGQYCYNPEDGYVYFATKTFSPFQATYKAPVAAIGTAVYGTVQDAIMAAPESATAPTVITILKEVKEGAAFGYPDSIAGKGRNVIIDFAGHSYEFKTPGMGSTGTETQAMHLIHGNAMTLKNGTISVSKDSTAIKRMIQNYCDLTMDNMTVDCTNVVSSYNNSMCSGSLTVKGNTNFIASSENAKIFDVDGTYGQDVVVVFDSEYTGTTSGVIEYVASTGTHSSTLEIKSGTFTGNITSSGATKPSITGGTFAYDPTEYVADGYEAKKSGNMYVVSQVTYWSDYAAESYATPVDADNKIVTIASAKELALFAKQVNAGKTYEGYTVNLTNNIDLAGKRWTPIGNQSNTFQGHFDGQSHTISNLEINIPRVCDVGLFGFTTNGSVKNIVIDNASVVGYLDVGVVAGTPYTSSYSNITVQGNIYVKGYAYVGGMFGKNLYANADQLTLNANQGSYVKADSENYRTYVGGIVGFMGEGNHVVSNVTSNIDVYGTTCDVGGITGIAHYSNTFKNCTATGNVTITSYSDEGDQLEIGGIAGVWNNENGTKVEIDGCTFTGTLKARRSDGTEYTGEFKYQNIVGRQYSAGGTGKLYIDGVLQS